jgi:4-hydroxybenzoate polyprenyltransferase
VAAYFILLRPKQWLKNLMLLFPPLFGGILFNPGVMIALTLPLLAFCLMSSANYVFNVVLDADKDALHPCKKQRPIPAGKISRESALLLGCMLLTVSLFISAFISLHFSAMLIAYAVLMGGYSISFKHFFLVDIFCIAAGFLLRLEAGGIVANISVSSWLFLSVFFLTLFLSSGKRLSEKLALDDVSALHRKTLAEYPDTYLDGMMLMTGTASMLTYALYTVDHANLIYTVPLCCFGLFRYLFWVKTGRSGDPTDALLKDHILLSVSIAWIFLVSIVVYG